MPYAHFARLHTALLSLRREEGQGTVEYVGVVIVVGAIIAAVLTSVKGGDSNIASSVVRKIETAIKDVGK
jgi:H+/gluconate symporter-like permease